MCFAANPPQEKTQSLPRNQETPEPAEKEEREAPQIQWTRSRTTCDFPSKFSSSPTKQKKTKNYSPSYIKYTQKEIFLRGGKKKLEAFLKAKAVYCCQSADFFFSASGNYMRIGDFSREEILSLVIT